MHLFQHFGDFCYDIDITTLTDLNILIDNLLWGVIKPHVLSITIIRNQRITNLLIAKALAKINHSLLTCHIGDAKHNVVSIRPQGYYFEAIEFIVGQKLLIEYFVDYSGRVNIGNLKYLSTPSGGLFFIEPGVYTHTTIKA